MEMLSEIEAMIKTYKSLENDGFILNFIEELEEIKKTIFLSSKN